MRRRLAVALAVTLGSCAERGAAPEARGALYFRVQSSDADTVARLRSVRVLLRRSPDAAPYDQLDACFRCASRSPFPGVFAVTRDPSRDGPALHVELRAQLAGGAEFSQRASVEFAPRRALLVVFDLHAGCVGASCPAGLTCGGDGTCSVPVTRRDLPDYDPAREPPGVDLGALTADDAEVVADALADAVVDAPAPDAARDAMSSGADACVACEEAGRCTEVATDPLHCGGCDQRCGLREGCSAGRCVPVQVSGIAAASDRTCARMSDGTVRCWGLNSMGELGVVTGIRQVARPARVPGLRGVSQLAAADATTCALTDARVACFGEAVAGVEGFSGVRAIAVGRGFVCAAGQAGGVRCVGSNSWGQLGDLSTTDRATPVEVMGVPVGAASVRAGYHSACAVAGGRVACWGMNLFDQLGGAPGTARCEGGFACRPHAVAVDGLTDVEQAATLGLRVPRGLVGGVPVVAQHGVTCVVGRSRDTRCWGQEALTGLGAPTTERRAAPGVVIPGLRAVDVQVGFDFACALEEAGTVVCWGENRSCQTGDAMTVGGRTHAPVRVAGLTEVRALALGLAHACALRADGEVLCWGSNSSGQLGQRDASGRHHTIPSLCQPAAVMW
ncbi:MAG: hypothetical protein U0325_04365 [Polyangiales bacterium]